MVCSCVSVAIGMSVVGAGPVAESPGSCREGAGSIPAVHMSPPPKRRQETRRASGCSECAPAAVRPGPQAVRATGGGGGVFFPLWGGWGGGGLQTCGRKSSEAHLPRPAEPVSSVLLQGAVVCI